MVKNDFCVLFVFLRKTGSFRAVIAKDGTLFYFSGRIINCPKNREEFRVEYLFVFPVGKTGNSGTFFWGGERYGRKSWAAFHKS